MKTGTLIAAAVALAALKLALIGGIVYVAWHFISKYW